MTFRAASRRQAALTRMEKAQAKVVDEIWQKRAPDLPIKSPGEMVTLASIVEKETGKADERPRVAGVFVNRLQKHMRLESDPTIVYGLVFGKGTLGHPITRDRAQPADALQHLPHRRPSAGADLQSRQGGAGGGRQSLPKPGSLLRRRRNRRPRVRRDVRPAPEERRPLAADREGRQGQARARRDPASPRRRSTAAIDPVDPASFGALVAPASPQAAPAAVMARLAQIGAGRKAMSIGARVRFRRHLRAQNRWKKAERSSPASTTRRPRATLSLSPTRRSQIRMASPRFRFRLRCLPIRGRARPNTEPPPVSEVANAGATSTVCAGRAAGNELRPAAHLRRLRGDPPRSAAQQDLRPQLREGRAGLSLDASV